MASITANPRLPHSEPRSTGTEDYAAQSIDVTLSRLRGERDELRRCLEFLETETSITIRTLTERARRAEVRLEYENSSNPTSSHSLPPVSRRHQRTIEALSVVVDHLDHHSCGTDMKLDDLKERVVLLKRQLRSSEQEYLRVEASLSTEKRLREGLSEETSHLQAAHDSRLKDYDSSQRDLAEALDRERQSQTKLSIAERCIAEVSVERDTSLNRALELEATIARLQEELSFARGAQDDMMHQHTKGETSRQSKIDELQARILRRNEQIGQQQHDNRRLETNLKIAEDTVAELKEELDFAAKERECLVEDCATARNERDSGLQRLEELEDCYDNTCQARAALEDQVETLREQSRSFQSELELEDARTVTLVDIMMKLAAQSRVLERSCRTASESARTSWAQSAEVEGELRRRIGEIEDLTSRLISSNENSRQFALVSDAKDQELKTTAEELRKSREALTQLGDDLTTLREQHESETKTYLSQKSSLSIRIQSLEAELADKEEHGQEQSASARRESEAYMQQTKLLHARVAELEIQAQTDKEAGDTLQRCLDERQKESVDEVAKLRSSIAELTAMAEERQSTLEELEKRLQGRDENLLTLREELAQSHVTLNSQRQTDASEIESLQARLNDQQVQQQELRQNLDKAGERVHELESSLTNMQSQHTDLQGESTCLTAEVQQLLSMQRHLEGRLGQSEENVTRLRGENETLVKDLSQAQQSSSTAEMNVVLQKKTLERTISQLQNELVDLRSVPRLDEQVKELSELVTELEGMLRQKTSEIEDNDDKMIELLKEKKKLGTRVESLSKKNQSLQSKLDELLSKLPLTSTLPLPIQERSSGARMPFSPSTAHNITSQPVPAVYSHVPMSSTEPVIVAAASGPALFRAITPKQSKTPESKSQPSIPASSAGKKRATTHDEEFGASDYGGRDAVYPDGNKASTHEPSPSYASRATRSRKQSTGRSGGFTPKRGKTGRPEMGPPSPLKRLFTDVLPFDNPILQTSAKEAAQPRSWLNKLKGGTR